jgi:hypothetical protein
LLGSQALEYPIAKGIFELGLVWVLIFCLVGIEICWLQISSPTLLDFIATDIKMML